MIEDVENDNYTAIMIWSGVSQFSSSYTLYTLIYCSIGLSLFLYEFYFCYLNWVNKFFRLNIDIGA